MDIEEGPPPPQNGRGIGNDRRFSPDLSVQTEAVPIDNHFLPQYGEIVFFGEVVKEKCQDIQPKGIRVITNPG